MHPSIFPHPSFSPSGIYQVSNTSLTLPLEGRVAARPSQQLKLLVSREPLLYRTYNRKDWSARGSTKWIYYMDDPSPKNSVHTSGPLERHIAHARVPNSYLSTKWSVTQKIHTDIRVQNTISSDFAFPRPVPFSICNNTSNWNFSISCMFFFYCFSKSLKITSQSQLSVA